MRYLARFSPLRAVRDLRMFLSQRQPYELWFMMLAIVLTGLVLFAFVKDSHFERAYKPDIIYVQQWPLDRTDEQIRALQKIDQAKKEALQARLAKRRAEQQAAFKRIDDKLESYGF